jgi:hypothetical protein
MLVVLLFKLIKNINIVKRGAEKKFPCKGRNSYQPPVSAPE